jgi:hypothetical protein
MAPAKLFPKILLYNLEFSLYKCNKIVFYGPPNFFGADYGPPRLLCLKFGPVAKKVGHPWS